VKSIMLVGTVIKTVGYTRYYVINAIFFLTNIFHGVLIKL
jgi:hypothetical protein